MARETSRERIEVYEVRYDNGGVGLAVGNGAVHVGYDGQDAAALIEAALDTGDLWDVTGNLINNAPYLTTEQVCDLYGVTRRTVYRWKQAGRLHGTKAGRRLLFDRAEVEALAGTGEGMA